MNDQNWTLKFQKSNKKMTTPWQKSKITKDKKVNKALKLKNKI